jgi:hypothetical protein
VRGLPAATEFRFPRGKCTGVSIGQAILVGGVTEQALILPWSCPAKDRVQGQDTVGQPLPFGKDTALALWQGHSPCPLARAKGTGPGQGPTCLPLPSRAVLWCGEKPDRRSVTGTVLDPGLALVCPTLSCTISAGATSTGAASTGRVYLMEHRHPAGCVDEGDT